MSVFILKSLAQCSVRNKQGQSSFVWTVGLQTEEDEKRQRKKWSCGVYSKATTDKAAEATLSPGKAQIIIINILTLTQIHEDHHTWCLQVGQFIRLFDNNMLYCSSIKIIRVSTIVILILHKAKY